MSKTLVLFFSLFFTLVHATGCVDWPADVLQPVENSKTHQLAPDYGIYWFKMSGDKQLVAKAFLPPTLEPQFSNGELNQLPAHETIEQARLARILALEQQGFFDPTKPTIIFIHGVQTTETIRHHRFDFCYQFPEPSGAMSPVYDALPFWKDWNVGVFYWNQFADVQHMGFLKLDAIIAPETRIYNSAGSDGMDWVYLDKQGALATCTESDKHCMVMPKNALGKSYTISELAFLAFKNAIPDNYHQPLRIAGFSLGNQIAILLTREITQHPNLLQPSQLILLDPYFTPNFYKINIGDRKVAIAPYNKEQIDYILATNHHLALSFYRSSTVSSGLLGDLNLPLQQESAYLRVCPVYLDHLKSDEVKKLRHLTGLYYYFYSKRFSALFDDSSREAFAKSYPGANSLTTQIKALMGQSRVCNLNNFGQGCQGVVALRDCN